MGRIELEFHKIVFSFSLTLYFHRLIKRCSLKLVQSSAVSFPTLKKPTTIARCLRRCFQTAATSYHTIYWMPKWSDTTDPSARTLNHYVQ